MTMDMFRDNKLFLLLIILLGVITVLSAFIFIFPASDYDKFEKKLELIDSEIDTQHYNNASKEIRKASRFIHEYRLWLKLLKRSYSISEKTNDYSIYLFVAKRAVKDLKGNEECWGFYISALLWNDQILEASKYLDKLESSEYDSLKGEILLILENRKLTGDESLTDNKGLIQALEKRRDPILYEKIGLIAQNDYLLFNSALLWMREGLFDRAHNILGGLRSHNPSLLASAYISYDSKNYTDTINYLLTLDPEESSELMLLGDSYYYLFLKTKEKDKITSSLSYYKEAERKNASEVLWRINANLSQFHNSLGEKKKAYQYSLRNINEFPFNPSVIVHFVENNYESHPVLCKQAIDYYLQEFPEDTEINLLRIKYFPEVMTIAEMKSFLWEIFNGNSNEDISQFFMWFLMGNRDYKSAEILLSRLDNMGKDYSWSDMYKSILFFLQQDYIQAEEIMSNYNYEQSSWFSNYNCSLMTLYFKNVNRSLELFLDSEAKLNDNEHIMEPSKYAFYMALINAYKSIIYNNMGLYEKADTSKKDAQRLGHGSSKVDSLLFNN